MIKIISNLVDVFSKEQTLMYTKADNGSMYISNGYFLGEISQKDFGELLAQLDRRKIKNKIELVERDGLKKYATEAKGNFEVSKPYEHEQSYGAMCVFADNKQHFAYNKKFLDVFDNGENRMFVDDNSTYDVKAHKPLTGLIFALALRRRQRGTEKTILFPVVASFIIRQNRLHWCGGYRCFYGGYAPRTPGLLQRTELGQRHTQQFACNV